MQFSQREIDLGIKPVSCIFSSVFLLFISFSAFANFTNEYREAAFLYKEGNYEAAFKKFLVLAKKGHDKSEAQVGYMYSTGRGVKQNVHKAITWYKKAANKGHPSALYSLAGMYRKGRGVKKDYKKAFDFYTKVITQSNPHQGKDILVSRSQVSLAIFHFYGTGTKVDYEKAIQLGETAVRNNAGSSKRMLAWFLSTCPDAKYRDGKRALKIIDSVLLTKKRSPRLLNIQAAAYAEVGDYKRAVETQKEAIRIMHHIKKKKTQDKYRLRLAYYMRHKPWREMPWNR